MYIFREVSILFGVLGIIGFVMILAGTSLFTYGGYIFYINTVALFIGSERLKYNIAFLRSRDTSKEDKRKTRKENFQFMLLAWRPTFVLLALGPMLIIVGAVILNISEGKIEF